MLLTSAVALGARRTRSTGAIVGPAELAGPRTVRGFHPVLSRCRMARGRLTVGVFRLEGRGVQLFDAIDGDHFTILGMPLIPAARALRERGLLPVMTSRRHDVTSAIGAAMIRLALTGSIGMGKSTVAQDVRARRRSGVRCRRGRARAAGQDPALVAAIGERFPGTVDGRRARPRAACAQRCSAIPRSSPRSKRSSIPRCRRRARFTSSNESRRAGAAVRHSAAVRNRRREGVRQGHRRVRAGRRSARSAFWPGPA